MLKIYSLNITKQKRFTVAFGRALICIFIMMFIVLTDAAGGQVKIIYDADSGLEPSDPSLGLGFWSVKTGGVNFRNAGKGPLLTIDEEADDARGGGGRYYRFQLTDEEFNEQTDLRIEVTVKVIESVVSPASTCVQYTTSAGRTFGLGFLSNEGQVILYADSGEPLELTGSHGETELWNPVILGSYSLPVNIKRTYVLEVLRQETGNKDDIVQLSIMGSDKKPLTAHLTNLKKRATVPGLVFGHPVNQGTGEAEWYYLQVTTNGKKRPAELPRRIGTKRQLFLDNWIIDKTDNLERRVEKPVKYADNPVLQRDKPWDASRCDLYGSMVWNAQAEKLQLFYSAVSTAEYHDDRLGYAESIDFGHTWIKPEFDFIPFGKHKKTNLILLPQCQFMAGPCVFRDEHDSDPSRRYKLFTSDYGGRQDGYPCETGMYVACSADGIHWDPSAYKRILPLVSDTAQCAFWDERIGKYVGYVRKKPKLYGRSVARTESVDFEHWSPPELCFKNTWRRAFYSMGVTPYEGIYIGTPWVLWRKCKDIEKHDPVISPGLAVSRDGWAWQMVTDLGNREEFIPVGPEGSADHRQIRMSSSLVVLEDRILFAYGQTDRPHIKDMRVEIGLATLRLDGFVAMVAGEKVGRLLTKPFVLKGNKLYLNAACDKNGSITAALLDENGKSLSGFTHECCVPIRSDKIKLPVTWRGNVNLRKLRDKTVRLELAVKKARLYSFWCENQSKIIDVGTRKQLLFDELFLEKSSGVKLRMNTPFQDPKPVLVADQPWEQNVHAYNTVLFDQGKFRMWYNVTGKGKVDHGDGVKRSELFVCYAESTDGVHWHKPIVGLIEHNGSKQNNILAPSDPGARIGGASVFRDDHGPAAERYKLWTKYYPSEAEEARGIKRGSYAMVSPDGLRWKMLGKDRGYPLRRGQASDSQNICFWDDDLNKYIGFVRMKKMGPEPRDRTCWVGLMTSKNFENWTRAEDIFYADEQMPVPGGKPGWLPVVDLYTPGGMKVPGVPDAYILLPTPYYHWREDDFPETDEGTFPSTIDVALATSRDRVNWWQPSPADCEPFLRLGPDGTASSGMIFANPWPIVVDDEIWFYYAGLGRSHGGGSQSYGSGIFRARLRRDGFVSVDAGYRGGEFTTPPVKFKGKRLELNLDGSAGGWLQVEIQSADGKPLQGYKLSDSDTIRGNNLAKTITWKDNPDASKLAGQPVRLRFVMRSMKLYAFGFVK